VPTTTTRTRMWPPRSPCMRPTSASSTLYVIGPLGLRMAASSCSSTSHHIGSVFGGGGGETTSPSLGARGKNAHMVATEAPPPSSGAHDGVWASSMPSSPSSSEGSTRTLPRSYVKRWLAEDNAPCERDGEHDDAGTGTRARGNRCDEVGSRAR
jgi:hypothetical protein